MIKLEIAAGENPQQMGENWIRHDHRALPNIDVVCDWRQLPDFLWSLGYREVTEIYCRHFIEHLSDEDGLRFLRMCLNILVDGGDLVIVCPNMKWLAKKYVNGGYDDPSEFVYWLFGGGEKEWNYHKTGYDAELLCRAMEISGFTIIFTDDGDYHLRMKGRKGPDGIVRLKRKQVLA